MRNFREWRLDKLRRNPLPRTRVNRAYSSSPLSVGCIEPLQGGKTLSREGASADERASQKGKEQEHPRVGQGLYYSSGLMAEVLVYYDDEAIYFEHKGKDSGIVRFTFEMIEGLKIVEEEEAADSRGRPSRGV